MSAEQIAQAIRDTVDACLRGEISIVECGCRTALSWNDARRLGLSLDVDRILQADIENEHFTNT